MNSKEPHEIWMLLCYDERTQKHSDFECETKEEAQSLINKGIESCPIHSFVRNIYVGTYARRVRVYENTPNGELLLMDFFMYRDIAKEWCDDIDCVSCQLNEHEERIEEYENDIVALSNRIVALANRLTELERKYCEHDLKLFRGGEPVDIAKIVDHINEIRDSARGYKTKNTRCGWVTEIPWEFDNFQALLDAIIDALTPF